MLRSRMTRAHLLSATHIRQAVGAGTTSAVEVAEETLARVAAYEAIQPQVWIERVPAAVVLAPFSMTPRILLPTN